MSFGFSATVLATPLTAMASSPVSFLQIVLNFVKERGNDDTGVDVQK